MQKKMGGGASAQSGVLGGVCVWGGGGWGG